MNFLISFQFSRWVFPFSNWQEIKGYLVDCSLFKENNPSEHSFNILTKFKKITSDLLFTCDTTVPELTANKNLLQLHIRDHLASLVLVVLVVLLSWERCLHCCHCGSRRKLIIDIKCHLICSLCKRESKKQIAKSKTTKLKKKWHANLVPRTSFRYKRKTNF